MKLFKRLGKNLASFDGRATMEDVTAAYRLFLKRKPDPEGYGQYQQLVANGLSLDRLISIFTTSSEYKTLMARESAITAVNLGGYSVCVRQSETDFGTGIIATRDYEPHVRRAIRNLLKEGQTFVDVGANVGCISFLAAQIVGPKGTVISIEPNPDNLQLLYAGIVLNGLENIRVLPYAASDRSGVFSLIGGTSNTHLVPAKNYTAFEFYAQSVVLDETLADLAKIDFVKMDVEGHEPLVLKGFLSLIRKHKPTLLTEFNPICLKEFLHIQPIEYLEQLFTCYSSLQALSAFGDSATFTDANSLMQYWSKRNTEIAGQNLLPDGMLHFDVIATCS